jgi:hypothetical protein
LAGVCPEVTRSASRADVEKFHISFGGDQQIRWPDSSMHNQLAMRVANGVCHSHHQPYARFDSEFFPRAVNVDWFASH